MNTQALLPKRKPTLRRVPRAYVKKYFGKPKFRTNTESGAKRACAFLSKQLGVSPDEITLRKGNFFVSPEAYDKLKETPVDCDKFIATGGVSRSTYEYLEMAYNDVVTGSLQALGPALEKPMKAVSKASKQLCGKSPAELLKIAGRSGALQAVRGFGAVATGVLGLWLGALGTEQMSQALARDDKEQGWEGARSMFLGAESLAASAGIVGKMGQNALTRTAGAVAKAVALPFAVIHGVIDVGQGTKHVQEGFKNKDRYRLVEGAAEIGMGVGWLVAGVSATPLVVAASCACLGVKIAASVMREKKLAKEAEAKCKPKSKSKS